VFQAPNISVRCVSLTKAMRSHRTLIKNKLENRQRNAAEYGATVPRSPGLRFASIRLLSQIIKTRACPIRGQEADADILMEGRIRPVRNLLNQLMFNGIPMDVIDMFLKIRIIPDSMLPKAALPQPVFAAMVSWQR